MRYPDYFHRALGNTSMEETTASMEHLAEAILLTAEICGRPLSQAAASLLAQDLAGQKAGTILAALARCRLELQGPLTTGEILLRIEDGRPDPETAWEMLPANESQSVVWTNEMVLAWSAALPALISGDPAGARDAFRQAYRKAVLEARMRQEPVQWIPSLGSDPAGRKKVLQDAVARHRLSAEHVARLLPATDARSDAGLQEKSRNLH